MSRVRLEFVPVVYEHAAAFLSKTPGEVAYSAELLVAAHEAAWKAYGHSSVTVGIDVYNLEAECYGARVVIPDGNEVPSIKEFPYQSCAEVEGLPFFDPTRDGRFPLIFQAARKLRERLPGHVDIRIPLGGPFSIASNLLGFENLLVEAFADPEGVRRALLHLAEGQIRIAQTAKVEGFGVTFFESAATPPLLSPELFRQVEKPALAAVMEGTAAVYGSRPVFIMGGNTFPVLPDVLDCNPSYIICPGETDQEGFMRYLLPKPELKVRINMSVEVVARGTEEELRRETERVFRLAQGRDPMLIGTGVLPYDVPPSRVHRIREFLEKLTVGDGG